MYRWYLVSVQSTLFQEFAVVLGWGRLGTTYARWRILSVENQAEAEGIAERIIARKIQRGYQFSRQSGRDKEKTERWAK